MNIILIGHGRMGRLIEEEAQAAGHTVAGIYDRANLEALDAVSGKADAAIDFSGPQSLPAVLRFVRRTGTPLVSGTTGYTDEQKSAIAELGAVAPVLWSANFSLGVAAARKAAALLAAALRPGFDIEITEIHHNQNADAPSGTAKLFAEAVDPKGELTPVYGREGMVGKRRSDEIGIHSLRGGTVAGTHTVYFFGPDETVELTHRAGSRRIFALGALRAAEKLQGMKPGCYSLDSLLFPEGN
jgi:4-hydroxy-tetrahydrodipicolinate reductase